MFDSTSIRGVIPAMLTPLTDDKKVDEIGLPRLVRFLLERGVHGIFTMGSSGEFPALHSEERQNVVRIVVEEVNGRVPVLAGASDSGTKRAISNVQAMQAAGADVAVVLPPYYMTCSEKEVLLHFQAILEETDMPILLYNYPGGTGVWITLDVIDCLAKSERIVGIKDSSGDFLFFRRLIQGYRDHPSFRVVQGHEGFAGVSYLLAAHAGHLGLANIAPQLFIKLYEKAIAGDLDEVLRLQRDIDEVGKIWDIGGGDNRSYFASMKAALNLYGVCGKGVSRPYTAFDNEETAMVQEVLVRYGLLP